MAVLYLDLDYFKNINDTFGHVAGDLVLRAVAHAIKDSVRVVDHVARFGGDEFAVIMEEVDGVANDVAVRILTAIKSLRIPWKDTEISVGTSIGMVVTSGFVPNLDDLLQVVDANLYSAKRGDSKVIWTVYPNS